MQRFSPTQRRFAYAVAGLAGFVDVTGYLELNGYFVSFMTGNTTLLARDLAGGMHRVAVPALLIGGFVIGVMIGTFVGERWPERRKPFVSGLVAAGLALAALARGIELDTLSLGLLVVSMGALNTAMMSNRGGPVGLTYMTGALVRTAQLLTYRLGGDREANPLPFALLWVSLLFGALCGAVVALYWGAASLWAAAAIALLLFAAALWIVRTANEPKA